jgi:hypothetical protein
MTPKNLNKNLNMNFNTNLKLSLRRERAGAPPGPLREFWSGFSANHGAVAGFSVIAILLLLAARIDQQ